MPTPSPALMEGLNPAQRSAFLRVWARLPPHLQKIAFDLHDPGWDPPAIAQLGGVLCDFLMCSPPRRWILSLAP